MKKSMIETAYTRLSASEGPMSFLDLWKDVAAEMGYTQSQFDDNIAQFYTDLSIDSRFLSQAGNKWDLRKRHSYSESVTDTDSLSLEDDGEDELLDEEEEESE
jgi:DNA-directed RNA polymerase subunit delta